MQRILKRRLPHPFARRHLSIAASVEAATDRAINQYGAPPSIAAVPELFASKPESNVVMCPLGSARKALLRDPYLDSDQLEGLAYRVRTLTKNEGISSILLTNFDANELQEDDLYLDFPPQPGFTYHAAGGYDAMQIFRSGRHKDADFCQDLMAHLEDLTLVIHGGRTEGAKIPTIAAPHGAVTDGGACLLWASYVLATPETTFALTNSSRGLTLDPTGLSYLLLRVGKEFEQPSAEFSRGCAILLAMGYEANAQDMMETGLATHYLDSVGALRLLEPTLAQLRPWDQQALVKKPKRFYGVPETKVDTNKEFRNVALADTIDCFSSYRADTCQAWEASRDDDLADPSLEFDSTPTQEDRQSDLVNVAASLDGILREKSLQDIYAGLFDVSHMETTDPDEQYVRNAAAHMVRKLDKVSPLAASVTLGLLDKGGDHRATLEGCVRRERHAQAKLMSMVDFERYGKQQNMKGKDDDTVFTGWKHKSFGDVSADEVEEIIAMDSDSIQTATSKLSLSL